jgi:hypothetical protein
MKTRFILKAQWDPSFDAGPDCGDDCPEITVPNPVRGFVSMVWHVSF